MNNPSTNFSYMERRRRRRRNKGIPMHIRISGGLCIAYFVGCGVGVGFGLGGPIGAVVGAVAGVGLFVGMCAFVEICSRLRSR